MLKYQHAFVKELRKYSRSSILKFISRLTWERGDRLGLSEQEATRAKYYQHIYNIIAVYAILFCRDDGKKRIMKTMSSFGVLANQYYSYSPEMEERIQHASGTRKSPALGILFRTAFQQLFFQRDYEQELGRTLLLYNEILAGAVTRRELNYTEAYESLYGMSLNRFIFISNIIRYAYLDGARTLDAIIAKSSTMPSVTEDEVVGVYDILSTTVSEIRKAYLPAGGYDHYVLNPLQVKPIIRLGRGEFVIPSFYYYGFRLTDGVYYDLAEHYRNPEDKYGSVFQREFGEAFEDYVEMLLKNIGKEYIKEFEYAKGKKFSDYSFVEGDAAILMECKTKRITLQAKQSGNYSLLEQDLAAGVIAALKQIENKIADIRNGVAGLSAFQNCTRYYGIVLLSEKMHFGNTRLLREIIARHCMKNGINISYEYHIMEIDELEKMTAPMKSGLSWAQLLINKGESENYYMPFVSNYSITDPFPHPADCKLLMDRYEIHFKETIDSISVVTQHKQILPYLLSNKARRN